MERNLNSDNKVTYCSIKLNRKYFEFPGSEPENRSKICGIVTDFYLISAMLWCLGGNFVIGYTCLYICGEHVATCTCFDPYLLVYYFAVLNWWNFRTRKQIQNTLSFSESSHKLNFRWKHELSLKFLYNNCFFFFNLPRNNLPHVDVFVCSYRDFVLEIPRRMKSDWRNRFEFFNSLLGIWWFKALSFFSDFALCFSLNDKSNNHWRPIILYFTHIRFIDFFMWIRNIEKFQFANRNTLQIKFLDQLFRWNITCGFN